MRIGIDATFIGTSKPTGLAVYTWNMVNHLARIHNDVILWTADDYGFDLPPENVRLVLRNWAFLGEKRYAIRPFWMESCLPHLIRKERVDILYSTVQAGMVRCPVPHIITVTDLVPLVFPEDFPCSVRWNYRYRLPRFLKKADAVVAISEYTKQDLVERYGLASDQVQVSYPAYDAGCYRPQADFSCLDRYGLRAGNYVLAVGNAYRRKNLEGLIEAFGLIRERISHQLVLVGPFSREQAVQLERVARENGIGDRLILPGYVSAGDLPVVYSGAALFCYLSLYEGFGIPVLEAMACGTPVLASATTSVPEVAGGAALLVNPEDRAAVAEKMFVILDDPVLQENLRQAGMLRAQMFTWERSARQVLDVIWGCGKSN